VGVFVPRHRRALRGAIDAIRTSIEHTDPSAHAIVNPEIIALGLREALDALGELVGEVSPDDVIGRVFATFCVGK
jgi:tRNA modification GTPase